MTLLVAINVWDVAPWMDRFRRFLPEKRIVAAGEDFDPAEIRYVASWKHTPRSLAHLPNLEAILSLGAGVDHLDRRSRAPERPHHPGRRPGPDGADE
jgi:glyoxylate/hydroxypyruvate reductase A